MTPSSNVVLWELAFSIMQGHQEQMHFIKSTTLNRVMNLNGLLDSGGPGLNLGYEVPQCCGRGHLVLSSESQFLPI